MNGNIAELQCSLTIEHLTASGQMSKKTAHRYITLLLGRNEFRDIVLKIQLGKQDLKFMIRNIQVHKKFVKDGKATVKLCDRNVQLLLSNCPPDQLIVFLKTMSTKLECLKQKGFVSERQKLKSDLPRTFDEISPLNIKELQTVHSMRAKQVEEKTDLFTPKGKRKRVNSDDKENRPPESSKMARKTLSSLSTVSGNENQAVLPVRLSAEQIRVLTAVQSGRNIFFTGSAGTGKSFLLRRIIGALPPQHTFATASTGVAACHIGGTTLHAFAGIGSGKGSVEQCVELASRPLIAAQWRKCKHLIIDEISMVDGNFFHKMEIVARIIRKSDEKFGGIQLILCGDFLQLPPVVKGMEKRKFCFQSSAWRKCIDVNLELADVRRQSDQKFINILQNVRLGRCPPEVINTLTATSKHCIDRDGILATRLCTHKEDVDQINQLQLDRLDGKAELFEAVDSDPNLVKMIDNQCPVKQKLVLKVGAQVMLAKNLDVQRGLVNGARGVVTGFEPGTQSLPIVKFVCGVKESIKSTRWSFKAAGGLVLTRRQLPLKMAWAISIHKSQGMSLDCVEMSLSRVFESGQAYVALSRARSLEGLRVLDFDKNIVRANPDVIKFYKDISLSSITKQTSMDRYTEHSQLSW